MSARSLSVFLRMFVNNGSSLLHPRSILEMRTVVGDGNIPYYNQNSTSNNTSPLLSRYGLGWYWQTASTGRRYIGHGGALPGMAHLMLVNEQSTIGVIVLTNGDTIAPINLSREVSETLANIHLTLFDCFETKLTNSAAVGKSISLLELFFACFLLFHFFSSY
jgi:CubicO group peptidase (beta-lactamase class C family)